MVLQYNSTGVCRAARVGSGWSDSGSGGSMRFCHKIKSDVVLGIHIIKLTDQGGHRFRIGVVRLEE